MRSCLTASAAVARRWLRGSNLGLVERRLRIHGAHLSEPEPALVYGTVAARALAPVRACGDPAVSAQPMNR